MNKKDIWKIIKASVPVVITIIDIIINKRPDKIKNIFKIAK